jgi:predicted TIM-barrel enzyme
VLQWHRQFEPVFCFKTMPNPWTGKGNPYTRKEVRERLMDTIKKGDAVIAAGAGAGISAKFIEKGGADLIIIYNSGRFRMMGHGSTCGMMAYGDANAIAMEIGEYEVLPVVEEVPVICGVHATDPRRRMWHWLGKVKEMGFSGVNNFPTHTIIDGHFRGVLEETGMSVKKEYEMVALARKMDLFSIVYVGTPEEAVEMAKSGADAIIAHVGTTVGGSIGVQNAVVSWDFTLQRTQEIIDAASRVRKDIFFLCHGGPINTPADADRVMKNTDAVGFVGASSRANARRQEVRQEEVVHPPRRRAFAREGSASEPSRAPFIGSAATATGGHGLVARSS